MELNGRLSATVWDFLSSDLLGHDRPWRDAPSTVPLSSKLVTLESGCGVEKCLAISAKFVYIFDKTSPSEGVLAASTS